LNALRNACLHEREDNGLPSMEGGPSNILQSYKNGRKRNWEAMNVGTLVTSEERMLECIFEAMINSKKEEQPCCNNECG
jgi:hypothetical protein